jgi:hypothetical protein
LHVLRKLGPDVAEQIDWSGPRLLCIAGDFTRYDEYAVLQIPRNIELLRYPGGDLLLLKLVRASQALPNQRRATSHIGQENGVSNQDADARHRQLQDVWQSLKAFLLALGDDESGISEHRARRDRIG